MDTNDDNKLPNYQREVFTLIKNYIKLSMSSPELTLKVPLLYNFYISLFVAHLPNK